MPLPILKLKSQACLSAVFKKRKKVQRHVIISRQAVDGIITWSKTHHPNETMLILKGRNAKDAIIVDGLVIPPIAESGPFYSGFVDHDIPYTISKVGTARSHPKGSNKPSLEDLNHFYAYVSIIIGYPYEDEDIAAYDRNGANLEIKIVDSV